MKLKLRRRNDVSGPVLLTVATLKGHTDEVRGCGFSPDGQRIVSASSDETLKLWDVSTGAVLATLKGHTGGVNGCAFSPDGQRIVSASSADRVRQLGQHPEGVGRWQRR